MDTNIGNIIGFIVCILFIILIIWGVVNHFIFKFFVNINVSLPKFIYQSNEAINGYIRINPKKDIFIKSMQVSLKKYSKRRKGNSRTITIQTKNIGEQISIRKGESLEIPFIIDPIVQGETNKLEEEINTGYPLIDAVTKGMMIINKPEINWFLEISIKTPLIHGEERIDIEYII